MGDLHVDERNSPPVVSPEEMAGRFHGELIGMMPDWKRRLSEDPARLAELEHNVHDAFARGADLVVAGLVALIMKQRGFDEACEQTRQNYRFPLSRGRNRPLRIRLLGGLLVWVTSLYCEPRSRWFRKREDNVPGLHIELAQFGFAKGCSPAMESRVSRQAALCPSLQLAQEELARDGLQMDVKAVARVTYQCGRGMLALQPTNLCNGERASCRSARSSQANASACRWMADGQGFAGTCVPRWQRQKRRTQTVCRLRMFRDDRRSVHGRRLMRTGVSRSW